MKARFEARYEGSERHVHSSECWLVEDASAANQPHNTMNMFAGIQNCQHYEGNGSNREGKHRDNGSIARPR